MRRRLRRGVRAVALVVVPRGDHVRATGRPRRKDAVVQEQTDTGMGREDGQALEELGRLEQQVRRAVGPAMPQPQQNVAVRRALEPLLRNRRPEAVAAEALGPVAVACRRDNAGVQVEAVNPSVAETA